jgi:hypothetical protein
VFTKRYELDLYIKILRSVLKGFRCSCIRIGQIRYFFCEHVIKPLQTECPTVCQEILCPLESVRM